MKTLFLSLFFIPVVVLAQVSSAEVDEIVETWMSNHGSPAIVGCAVKNNEVIWMDAYGDAHAANNIPATVDTPFMLASVSKTYTGTAMLRLINSGLASADDPVNDHLDFDVIHPDFETPITIGQLLTHTSGIKDNWGVMPYCDGDCATSLYDFMYSYFTPGESNYSATQNFSSDEPGTSYDYSNIGNALIGVVVEGITEMGFNEFCEQEIFEPMCMDNTHWFLSEFDDVSLIATPHEYIGNIVSPIDHYGYPDYPDGQLRSSIRDVASWLLMNLNNGSFNFLEILPESLAQESMSPIFGGDQGYVWYSFSLEGDTVWGHNGGDAGVSTDICVSKENDVAVAILSNGEDNLFSLMADVYVWAKDTNGTGLGWPDCATDISEVEEAELNIYPNPAHSEVRISHDLATAGQIHIISVDGRLVLNQSFVSRCLVVSVEDLESGVYLVEVFSANQRQAATLVIE